MPPTLNFTILSNTATLPTRAHPNDAGLDLYAATGGQILPGKVALVSTGLAVDVPVGSVGLVHPRSGLALSTGVTVLNAPGTIDAGYEGELRVLLINHGTHPYTYRAGDRVAQLLIQEVQLLAPLAVERVAPASQRGIRGFGSTGA